LRENNCAYGEGYEASRQKLVVRPAANKVSFEDSEQLWPMP
jgi:hypothetical protein